jgi:hypothetical protein
MTDSTDWEARANREAAAIIMGSQANALSSGDFSLLRQYVAVGWLQGYNLGAHDALHKTEAAFTRLQEDMRQ